MNILKSAPVRMAALSTLLFSTTLAAEAQKAPISPDARLLGRWTNGGGFDLEFRRYKGNISGFLVRVPSDWEGQQRVGSNLFTNGVSSGQQIKGLWAQYPCEGCEKLRVLFVPATINIKTDKALIIDTQRAVVSSQTHRLTGAVRNCKWSAERHPAKYQWNRVGASPYGDESLVTADEFKDHVLDAPPGKKSVFDRMDTNGDGCLSEAEINAAVANPTFKGKDVEAISVIYNNPGIATLAPPAPGDKCTGISKHDVLLVSREDKNKKAVLENLDKIRRLKDKSRGNLFGPGDPINPSAVKQGDVGDCNFLSPLTSFADTPEGKQKIREMIKPAGKDKDGNDQYTVTFHDPKNPGKTFDVTVSKPTDAELINYAKGTENGMWPAVIEKAYGNWRRTHDQNGNITGKSIDDGAPSQLAAGGSMSAENAIKLLTGKKVENVFINSYNQSLGDLDKQLTNAFTGNKPIMTAAIEGSKKDGVQKPGYATWFLQPRGGLDGDASAKSGLYAGHEYSVLGYNPNSKQVTIRNPYGYNSAKDPAMTSKDGTFKMSLDDFRANFSHYTLAK